MRGRQNRTLESLRRAHSWLAQHGAILTDKPALQRQVQLLGDAVDSIEQTAANQELHRVSGLERSTSLSVLRRELRQAHMKPIVELARAVAPNAPEFAADVRLPAESVTSERLLVSAEAMARAVERKKELFVDRGLPADFVEQLRRSAAALRQTIDARGTSRATRVGATASLETLIADGMRTMQVLDAVLKRELRGTPEVREWASAKRIRQPSQTVAQIEGVAGKAVTAA